MVEENDLHAPRRHPVHDQMRVFLGTALRRTNIEKTLLGEGVIQGRYDCKNSLSLRNWFLSAISFEIDHVSSDRLNLTGLYTTELYHSVNISRVLRVIVQTENDDSAPGSGAD